MRFFLKIVAVVALLACCSVEKDATAAFAPLTVQRVAATTIEQYALVKIVSTGKVFPLLSTDSSALMTGVAQQAAAGFGVTISVQELYGVQTSVKSDGTTVINAGDLVDISATVNGRVRKCPSSPTPTLSTICTAVTDAAAVAGTVFQCL